MPRHRDPSPLHAGPRNDLKTLATLLPYLWPVGETGLRLRVASAMLLLVAAKVVNVAAPIFYKHAVDALSDGSLSAAPLALLIAYGLARMTALAFGEFKDAIFVTVAQRAIRQAGLKTFRHLHRMSMRFHLDRKTGGITRAVERGAKGIEFLLNFMLFNVLPTLLEILLVCVILWKMYGGLFAAVIFANVVIYIAWTLAITEWRTKFRRAMNRTDSDANAKAIDSLLNFETVKYFCNEDHEARRYDESLKSFEWAAVKSKTTLSLLNTGQGAIVACGLTVIMTMAADGVVKGVMTVGDFVLVNSYLIQLYLPLNFLGFVYREIKQSLTDMEVMFSLLEERAEIEDASEARPLEAGGGAVTFEGVSFCYDPRLAVLDDVSFTAPAGTTVAIVGPSGAGKSTISRLLFRFYDVNSGRILIDGQDIRSASQESLRAAIGIVPQDTVLFNDSIYYNIAYGRPGATTAEIEEAARLARIHDFVVGLPDGYRTVVGERGLKLSGGEKQRVAIARTILKQPRILVFDEATSALDTHTEKEIQESLYEVSAGRTTLIIAHRLSTVVDADEIVVLEAGRIVERGAHARLLEQGGVYAGMWAKQQEAALAREVLESADDAPGVVG